MSVRFDAAIAREIIGQFDAAPEMLVQVLQAFVQRYGFISDEAQQLIAEELNLSRADVHGVVSFYHDFRTTAPGKHVLKICQAEACQAMGSRELTAHAEKKLATALHSATTDGRFSLEPVYCLGNCACAPAVMLNQKTFGRVSTGDLDELLDSCGNESAGIQ